MRIFNELTVLVGKGGARDGVLACKLKPEEEGSDGTRLYRRATPAAEQDVKRVAPSVATLMNRYYNI